VGSGVILWAPANPELDEHEVLQAVLDVDEDLVVRGAELPRPSFKREKKRKGDHPTQVWNSACDEVVRRLLANTYPRVCSANAIHLAMAMLLVRRLAGPAR
jgi:hypothetical protein